MAGVPDKAAGAFRTIGELSRETGLQQHILRYWETRFPQLRPMQRAGNRRYYRRSDVDLARRIHRLLNQEGYTVRGVQKLLRERSDAGVTPISQVPAAASSSQVGENESQGGVDVFRLIALRDRLAAALNS